MGWDNLEGCDGVGGSAVQKGGDICTHPADSLHCKAETDNIVKQFYSNKKSNGLQRLCYENKNPLCVPVSISHY